MQFTTAIRRGVPSGAALSIVRMWAAIRSGGEPLMSGQGFGEPLFPVLSECERMRAGQEEGDVMVIPRGHRPSQEALRAAEGTIARYGIRDSTSISDMVNDRALKSGGILTVVAVLWWLTVYRQGDQFSSQSIFFGLGFVSVSLPHRCWCSWPRSRTPSVGRGRSGRA